MLRRWGRVGVDARLVLRKLTMSNIEDRAKTVIAVQLGVVGSAVGRGIQFSEEAEICRDDGIGCERRWGEDWRGDASRHECKLRNRTHGRIYRPQRR